VGVVGKAELPAEEGGGTERQGAECAYAKGGRKDVRLRAVIAVRNLERGVAGITGELRRTRRIGRGIRLRYHRVKGTFEWKQRNPEGGWLWLGARMPVEVLRRVRSDTRARIRAIEELIEVRAGGRRALQLIRWCLARVESWETETLQVTWTGSGGERVTWGFGWDGRLLRRGNYRAGAGVPEKHKALVENFLVASGGAEQTRPVAEQVEELVKGLAELDRRLTDVQGTLDGGCRLYYSPTRDSWRFHQLTGKRNSRYLTLEEVVNGRKQVPMPEGASLLRGVDLLKQRRQVKRCLGLVAIVGEAACRWPSGRWQVRGVKDGNQTAVWAAVADHGVVVRIYTGGGNAEEGTLDERGGT
jgi:hypothetical protein